MGLVGITESPLKPVLHGLCESFRDLVVVVSY